MSLNVIILAAGLGKRMRSRLPKVLHAIGGRPMLAHVVEAARRCPQLSDVIVATDSDEVLAVCNQNGWRAEMTRRRAWAA